MLFSSYDFVFLFLPLVLILSAVVGRFCFKSTSIFLLLLSSLVFYGWSNAALLLILGASILSNVALGELIYRTKKRIFLILAIALNLGLLGYFKYINFCIDNVSTLLNVNIETLSVALPLGISFFTFQQIGYQVDIYKRITKPAPFFRYALFVSFFPQLIAGPIVHYKRFLPQLENLSVTKASLAVGITLFVIGLSKKILIADKLAPFVNYYFNGIGQDGFNAGLVDTWLVVFAYSFQLYFDFSGYADMALGVGLCFSIVLPINFFSPYKASSLTDFWRRWHITLSDFLREYIYIPLGGNKEGQFKQYRNILLTMLLGGIWHGAGWNFIVWGALSGLIMGAERLVDATSLSANHIRNVFRIALTYLIVSLLWVLFRADNLDSAFYIYSLLFGHADMIVGSAMYESQLYGVVEKKVVDIASILLFSKEVSMLMFWAGFIGGCMVIAFALPNTAQLFREHLLVDKYNTRLVKEERSLVKLSWKPNIYWVASISFLMLSVTVFMKRQAEFLYFQF